jgi:hypothetical protein
MSHRAGRWNLAVSLVAFLLFMIFLLAGLGALGGVGTVELGIWLVLLVVGVLLIVRRHQSTRRRETGIES